MIITVANAKGGVAKTTSAVYLGEAYRKRFDRPAVVLDADIQASASLWRDMAEDADEALHVDVRPANLSTLQRIGRLKTDDGLIVVDAPPQGKLLESAIMAADFVVVPTSDSPLDLQQAWATLAAIPQGKPCAVLIVRAEPRTKAFQATRKALMEQRTPCFDTAIPKRQDIKAAMGHTPRKMYEYADALDELLKAVS